MQQTAEPRAESDTRDGAAASGPQPLDTAAPAIVGPPGEACPNCQAVMAADQRYCLECGQRRGEPRFPFMDGRTKAPPPPPPATVAPLAQAAQPRSKWSGGLSLILGVGVLILAMGVGVLIGNKGGGAPAASQQPVIIGGIGASAATGATGAVADAGANAGGTTSSATKDEAGGTQNVDALAKKNGVKLAPKDAKLGDKCEKGAVGCKNGTFDGNYFGN